MKFGMAYDVSLVRESGLCLIVEEGEALLLEGATFDMVVDVQPAQGPSWDTECLLSI